MIREFTHIELGHGIYIEIERMRGGIYDDVKHFDLYNSESQSIGQIQVLDFIAAAKDLEHVIGEENAARKAIRDEARVNAAKETRR